MKKLNLTLKGHEMLSKQQMKNIGGGGEHECLCVIDCYNVDDYYLGSIDDGTYCDTSIPQNAQQLINDCNDEGFSVCGGAEWYCKNAQ